MAVGADGGVVGVRVLVPFYSGHLCQRDGGSGELLEHRLDPFRGLGKGAGTARQDGHRAVASDDDFDERPPL
jgi:hypothetical protein